MLRRKHVNPERRLQTDYAPSAAPSEAPTFATYMPTAENEHLGVCRTADDVFTCAVAEAACEATSGNTWTGSNLAPLVDGCCVCELGCDHSQETGDKGSICLANVGTGDSDTVDDYIKFAVGVLVNADPNDLLLQQVSRRLSEEDEVRALRLAACSHRRTRSWSVLCTGFLTRRKTATEQIIAPTAISDSGGESDRTCAANG